MRDRPCHPLRQEGGGEGQSLLFLAPLVLTPGTTSQGSICSTFVIRQKEKRVNVSQTLHPLENSPLANAKGAGCGLGYLHKNRAERRRQRLSQEVTRSGPLAGTRWFLPPQVMTKNLGLPQASVQTKPFPWKLPSWVGIPWEQVQPGSGTAAGRGIGRGTQRLTQEHLLGKTETHPEKLGLPSLAVGAKGLLLRMLALKSLGVPALCLGCRDPKAASFAFICPCSQALGWGGV